jgi:predicted PurR-regulated permease PerM
VNLTLSPRERTAVRLVILTLPVITVIVAIFLIAYVANIFFSILVMFFLAWLLAFLLEPFVSRLVARMPFVPRGVAAAFVFVSVVVLAILVLAGVASSVVVSLTQILGSAGTIDEGIAKLIGPIQTQIDQFGFSINLTVAAHDLIQGAAANTNTLLSGAVASGLALFSQGTAVIFIAVVFVANKGRFLSFMRRLVPADRIELYDEFLAATSRSFGGFIRGQFGTAALYGVIVAVIGMLFGVPFIALTGLVTTMLQSIPYFGQLVSWIPLVLITLIFSPDQFTPVVVLLIVMLLVMQNLVTPRVMGSAVGINPVLVLAAVFIGAQVAGAFGAIFGVPVLAVVVSLLDTYLDRMGPGEDDAEEHLAGGSRPGDRRRSRKSQQLRREAEDKLSADAEAEERLGEAAPAAS